MVKLPPEIELMDKEEQEDYIRRMKQLAVKKTPVVNRKPAKPVGWDTMSKIEQRDYKRFMKEKKERGFKQTWKEHLANMARSARFWDKENIRLEENAARIATKVKKQLEEAAALPKKVFSTPAMREEAAWRRKVEAKSGIEIKAEVEEMITPVVNIIKEKVSVVQRDTFPLKAVIVGMVGIGAATLYFMRKKK